jgi:alpha-1,3-rhamnosyl/mannosyltransferase
MSVPLVVVDADVLGRRRTGDETYVRNLLRELGAIAPTDLRIAAVTRRPELVPDGIEPLRLRTPVQELRMLASLPRLLRRTGAALVHTQYAVPVGAPCPAVVTIHDLSFEHGDGHMPLKDRLVFRTVVPRSARHARRVLTVSERTRADLVRHYALPPGKVVVTPNGVDPAFVPGNPLSIGTYVLAVGAVQPRKNQRAALAAAAAVPLPLVIAGPIRDDVLAGELRAAGADLRGYVPQEELVGLYQGAACLVQPSRFEGFGLPVLEAMACGIPVVAVDEPALREVAGDAAVFVGEDELVAGVARALEERERLVAAGLERVEAFSWRATAERTLAAYREALG